MNSGLGGMMKKNNCINMPELLAFDLDKTLLRDDKSVSAYTLAILERCRQQHIKIAIATARTESASKSIIELITPDYAIMDDGALAKNNNHIFYQKTLPAGLATEIMHDNLDSPAVTTIMVETVKHYYVSNSAITTNQDYADGIFYDFTRAIPEDVYKITFKSNNTNLKASRIEK
jgi:HAD superfamily hydrolase (TIGR01484 family)